jgi:hypothetical protein
MNSVARDRVSGYESGVVPRRYELRADAVGVVEQLAKLEPVVAHHAGIGRAALCVLVDEVVDDLLKLLLQVEGIKRNVEPLSDAAGVLGIAGAAASLLVIGPLRQNRQQRSARGLLALNTACHWRLLAVAHEDPHDLVPLLQQQVRSDAAVDTAAHG